MDFYEEGKQYWTIIKRVREHNSSPLIIKVAIRDLNLLIATTKSDAVRKRAMNWIASHNQTYSPSNNGGGDGPRYA